MKYNLIYGLHTAAIMHPANSGLYLLYFIKLYVWYFLFIVNVATTNILKMNNV